MNTREKAERILAEIAQSDHSDPLDVAGVCQAYLTQRNEVLEEAIHTVNYSADLMDAIDRLRSLKDNE